MILLLVLFVTAFVAAVLGMAVGFGYAMHRLPYRERWRHAFELTLHQNATIVDLTEQATMLTGEFETLRLMASKSKDAQIRENADLRAALQVARADADAVQLALSDRPHIEAKLVAERMERQSLEHALNRALEQANAETAIQIRKALSPERQAALARYKRKR